MLFRNSVLLIFAVLLCSFKTGSEEFTAMKDIAKFRNGLDKMAASTRTIKASFQQEKYLSILENNIDSEGTILFKKPNLLKWQYTEPFEYLIILNGKEIIIKDQGNVNSFDIGSSQAFKQINELIINSVQGNVLDEKEFNIDYLENNSLYLTKLTPKEEQLKSFLKGIELYFDKTTFSVSKVKLIEPGDDYTLISFSNQKLNEPIADENFTSK